MVLEEGGPVTEARGQRHGPCLALERWHRKSDEIKHVRTTRSNPALVFDLPNYLLASITWDDLQSVRISSTPLPRCTGFLHSGEALGRFQTRGSLGRSEGNLLITNVTRPLIGPVRMTGSGSK